MLELNIYLIAYACRAVLSYGVVVAFDTSHHKAKQTTKIEGWTLLFINLFFLGMARIQLYYCEP